MRPEDHAAEPAAAVDGHDPDHDRAQRRRLAGRAVAHRPVDPARLRHAVPADRERARVADRLLRVRVDQPHLEIGIDLVEPRPERLDDRVVRHELRPDARQRAAQLRMLRVRDDGEIHRRSRATACAARPSQRPVKPRPSVVVARTATRSGSTPSASASRARIASRCGASRGSSPTGRRRRSRAPSRPPAYAPPGLAQQLDGVRAAPAPDRRRRTARRCPPSPRRRAPRR